MKFEKDNKVINEQISLYGKEMLAEGEDAVVFAKLLISNDFDNAYKMFSDTFKAKLTIKDFEKLVTDDPVDSNPTPSSFQEDQMPYKKVAIEFANSLVHKEFTKAFNMLTKEQQKENTVLFLEKTMQDMTSYFENPENIWVDAQFVIDEGAIDNKCIYVPICEEGNSEAVIVKIDYQNKKPLISNIEWGRP